MLNAIQPLSNLWKRSKSIVFRISLFLLPSFYSTHGLSNSAKDVHHTAYLDGLRGIAAIVVYVTHLSMVFDRTVLLGFVPGVSDAYYNLPIICLFRAGKAMVRVFFVISGYALTVSPAKNLDFSDNMAIAHHCIATAALKRPFRLFVPPLATTFVVLLLVLLGLYPTAYTLEKLPAHMLIQTVHYQPSLILQVGDWLGFITHKLTNPWAWAEDLFINKDDSYYGIHLWTIQTEFRCSMVLFAVLTVLSRLAHPLARHLLSGSLTLYCICWARWDVGLFLVGMQLCLADTTTNAQHTKTLPITFDLSSSDRACRKKLEHNTYLRFIYRIYPLLVLCVGLWALSYPEDRATKALGFGLASRLCSSVDFWQSIGAIVVVWSTGRLNLVKQWLCSPPLRYLGSVSFSLYLIHYPLLEMIGWRSHLFCREYMSSAASITGINAAFGLLVGNIFGFLLVTAGLVWLSDLTMRTIEQPSQRFLRWLVSSLVPR